MSEMPVIPMWMLILTTRQMTVEDSGSWMAEYNDQATSQMREYWYVTDAPGPATAEQDGGF